MEDIENVKRDIRLWFPRNILRRTNWLYRVDALRNHDIREMNILWEVASLFLQYSNLFLSWAVSIKVIIDSSADMVFVRNMRTMYDLIMQILQILDSEGYCYFLDFLKILIYG